MLTVESIVSDFKGNYIVHSNCYNIFFSMEFFTSALADGLSLVFEWQQVSSSLQDSFQYSSRSQQFYSLDSLHSSFNSQVL